MDFGNATEHPGSMSSLYEQNTDSMSTVAGNDAAPAEDPPVTETAGDEIDSKIFHTCKGPGLRIGFTVHACLRGRRRFRHCLNLEHGTGSTRLWPSGQRQ